MDLIPPMDAIFSTHLGQYEPRPAFSGPIVLRSSPDDDQDSMIARLRQQFPLECKAIVAPITNIHQWFDQYDAYRHGYGFLHSVLANIAFQNSKEVHHFVDRWRNQNPERFHAVEYSAGVTFTKAEITEHGSGFLAAAAQQIHYLRMSLQHRSSRTTDPSRDRRVEFYPQRGGPVANNTSRQPRFNSPNQPFGMRRPPMPQGAQVWNQKMPMNQVSNHNPELTSAPIPVYASTQFPVREQRPHFSARRVDFNSDPEEYAYRPSQEESGLFPYRRIPPSSRVPPGRYPSVEVASADQSSRKVFSNDARVLEMQELRSWSGNSNNTANLMTARQPVRVSSQVYQGSDESQDRTHSNLAPREDSSLTNDPAVVFIGNKVGNTAGTDNYQSYVLPKQRVDHFRHPSEQDPSVSSRDNSLLRQWSNSSTIITWDENDRPSANPHLGVENLRESRTHNDRNSPALEQSLSISPEQLQGSPTPVVIPNHEQRPFSGRGHWPARKDRMGRNPPTVFDEHKVFIRGLPAEISEDSIVGLLHPRSKISHVSSVKFSQQRDSHGYAFVTFENPMDAALAVKDLDSTTPACLGGRRLLVKFAYLKKEQHIERPEAALREGILASARSERPWTICSNDMPEKLIDQERGPDSESFIGGENDQFSKTSAARESPDKASSRSPNRMNPNEKRTSKKGSISSSKSGHSKKKSIQKSMRDSSATDQSLRNKLERNTNTKHETKSNKDRRADEGSLESRGTAADASITQTTPDLSPEQFPPLVSFHSTDLSKPSVAQPSLEIDVAKEPKVKPSKKEAKAEGNGSVAMNSDEVDRKQEYSSIEMVRGESASTAQSFPETLSVLLTEATSDAQSEVSIGNTNGAQVPMNNVAATEPVPMHKYPENTDSGLIQDVIELDSSEAECSKFIAADGKMHDIRTGHDPSHTVVLSMDPVSASNVVAETQAEEPDKVSPVVFIEPELSVVHDPTPAPDTACVIPAQTQPGENKPFVSPAKKSKASIVQTSPVMSSTASDHISSAMLPKAPKLLESYRPEVPLRTSSLSIPSTPILTHKKKQKVFTPVKTQMDQDHKPKDSTNLNPIRNFEQKIDGQVEKLNLSESKCDIKEELQNLQKTASPPTEPEKGTPSKEREDTTQRPPTSAPNLLKKSKRNSTGKKQKPKSKAGRASPVVAVSVTAVDSSSGKPPVQKNLPEPETPYLLDDQYILPKVTIYKSSQATQNDSPHSTKDIRQAVQTIRDQEIDEFKNCDTLERYAHLKGCAYEPYAAYLQDDATFSSIHSSRPLNTENLSEGIQSPADYPKPPGLAQQLAWVDQGPPKFKSWDRIIIFNSDQSHLESAPNESENSHQKDKARIDSSQYSDKDTGTLGTPDCDHSAERNLKSGRLSSSTDTTFASKITLVGVESHSSISDKPLEEEVSQASDLPFRQLYSNLDSSPRTQSTMAVLTSSFSPPSSLPFSATVREDLLKKGAFEHQIAEVAAVLPEPVTPSKAEPPVPKNVSSTADTGKAELSASNDVSSAAGTIVHKKNLDVTSSTHDRPILDLAAKTPVPSTPKRKQRKGHQRGVSSGSSSSCSTPRVPSSKTRSSITDSQKLSDAFAAITENNRLEYEALVERARSQAPTSPPRTPTHRPYLSYAAAALSPTKGSPPIAIGQVIQVGSPAVGSQTASGLASEGQAFVNLKDRMEVGPAVKGRKEKENGSSEDDPWRVPKGETVWGSGSCDKGSRSGDPKGSGSGAHKSP